MPAIFCGVVLLRAKSPALVGCVTFLPFGSARKKQLLCALPSNIRRAKRSLSPWLPGRFMLRIAFVNKLHTMKLLAIRLNSRKQI